MKDGKFHFLTDTQYDVTAQSYNRQTGVVTGPMQTERIDTASNELFKGIHSVVELARHFEAFWNDINPRSTDIVKVHAIKPVKPLEAPPPFKQ